MTFSPDGRAPGHECGPNRAQSGTRPRDRKSSRCPASRDLSHASRTVPTAQRLAAASQDGSVKVWDAVTGETFLTLRGHTSTVHGVTYSPDGRRLVTAAGGTSKGGGHFSGEVKLWDALTGQEILTLRRAAGPVAPCGVRSRWPAPRGQWGQGRDDLGRDPPGRGTCRTSGRRQAWSGSCSPNRRPRRRCRPGSETTPSATPCGSKLSPWSSRFGETACVGRPRKR